MTAYKIGSWGQTAHINWKEGVEVFHSNNRMAYLVKNCVPIKMTGRNQDNLVDDAIVPANSVVRLDFGTCNPKRKDLRIIVNPALLEKGHVSHPGIFLGDQGEQEICVYIHAFKQLTLDDYEWLIGLQLID